MNLVRSVTQKLAAILRILDIFVILIIGSALIIGLIFYAKAEFNQSDSVISDTSQWKSSNSYGYNFSLKYPPAWVVEEHSDLPYQMKVHGEGLSFLVNLNSNALNFDNPIKVREYSVGVGEAQTQATELIFSDLSWSISFDVRRKGNLYSFKLSGDPGVDIDKGKDKLLKILNSFKFSN